MTIFKKKYQKFTDEELMTLIQKGNTSAFNELYDRYAQRILYYFYRMLNCDQEKAQDFLQEIFLKLIKKPALFNPVKNFSSWVFTVAHNMCKNEYRRQNVRKQVEYLNSGDQFSDRLNIPADQKVDQKIFKKAILNELNKINPVHRSTFLLRYQENLSLKKISEIQGSSEGTIKSRLFYTTKKLADKLKKYNPNINEDFNNE